MIAAVLLFGHAALGLLSGLTFFLPARWRSRALIGIAMIGFLLAAAGLAWSGSGESFRGFELGGRAVPVAAGVAAAWLLIAALPGSASWTMGSLTGIACSALLLAATSLWVAPTLLFLSCALVAVAAASTWGRSRPLFWIPGFASVAALGAAFAELALGDGGWQISTSLVGWPRYVVIGAGVVLAGAIPMTGHWSLARDRAAAAGPLLTGGGFLYLHLALEEPDRWATLVLLFAGLLFGVAAYATRRFVPSLVGAAFVSLMAAAACAGPQALNAAAVAAVAGTAALALGTQSPLASAARTLAVGVFLPFLPVVAAGYLAAGSLEGSATSSLAIDRVPWTLVAVLTPVAMAVLVGAALRVARSSTAPPVEASSQQDDAPQGVRRGLRLPTVPGGTLAAWILVVSSVALALLPGHVLEINSSFMAAAPRHLLLFGVALLLAGGAAWFHRSRLRDTQSAVAEVAEPFIYEPGPRLARALSWVSVLLALAMTGLAGWITVEGLLVGFL